MFIRKKWKKRALSKSPKITSFEPLSLPEWKELLLPFLTYNDLVRLMLTNRSSRLLLYDENFWQRQTKQNFGQATFECKKGESAAYSYLRMLTYCGRVAMGSEKFIPLNQAIKRAADQDEEELLAYFYRQGATLKEPCIREYAERGCYYTARYLIMQKKEDHQLHYTFEALMGAIEGGRMALAERLFLFAGESANFLIREILEEMIELPQQIVPFYDFFHHRLYMAYQETWHRRSDFLDAFAKLDLKQRFIDEFLQYH